MEQNSESSSEKLNKKLEEDTEDSGIERQQEKSSQTGLLANSLRLVNAATCTATNASTTGKHIRVPLGTAARGSLSSQVMEYYQKYSQSSNLNKYFSLPSGNNYAAEDVKHYYSIYELNPDCKPDEKSSIGKDYNFKSYIPKERRRWVRPPLIGQSSSTDKTSAFVKSMTESQSNNSDILRQNQDSSSPPPSPAPSSPQNRVRCSPEPPIITTSITETPSVEEMSPSTTSNLETSTDRKVSSPTSSIASQHKPLEWDSGADVGYQQRVSTSISGGKLPHLSTIERMALARGCSAALRLDPEGTTEHQQQAPKVRTASPIALTFTGSENKILMVKSRPEASSTPMVKTGGNGASESENEVEITPIVKNYLGGLITGTNGKGESGAVIISRKKLIKEVNDAETPKSAHIFKLPLALNYSNVVDDSEFKSKAAPASTPTGVNSSDCIESSLKKSSSMNLLASPTGNLSLKRSQSELNLCGKEKTALPKLIFNSSSSIATVVTGNNIKPTTCNKLVQTSMKPCLKESIGVQVSEKEEEKPPLPKRANSLVPRSLCSILKTPKSTYKVQNPRSSHSRDVSSAKEEEEEEEEEDDDNDKKNDKEQASTTESSQNASLTPLADDTENVTGRANSFEYFPGHIYENVPNGSTSHVSSVDTGRCSNSTMPNTSSSLDEKLWGDSDSLVRDLERSVNILKSLVDANKLDRQVKKRLIHHVVKRLVTAKYSDDKIEHNLEENVPWNPADARNKVYRAEIIQALAKNTTDSSDDWKPPHKKKSPKKLATASETRKIKDLVNLPAEIESSISDKFDRNTDRTVMDGRKARMGLHDCGRRDSRDSPTDKSESSECFLPQRGFNKNDKLKDVFVTSTSNSSPQDPNRVLLDAVVNSRRSPVDSSHDVVNSANWRLPTTMSERRYELRRCSNTDSGDTKLVTYAEMEKRNQLIWITNEISHLSNLKKLLEQPKIKSQRTSKSPTRKSKQSPTKSKKSLPSTVVTQNGDVAGQLSRQWSSHCNLANCSTPVGTVKRMKKRNSCTQTVTDTSAAYSRTGSEIVSAKITSPNTKLTNVCCQTSKPVPVSTSVLPVTQVNTDCPVHRVSQSFACTCTERICMHCKSKKVPQQHCWFVDIDKEDALTESQSECNNLEESKKTINHLKSVKVKCNCGIDDNIREKQKGVIEKTSIEIKNCTQHRQDDSACLCGRDKSVTSSSRQSSKDCDCGNKLICGVKKLNINKSPRKKLFEKSTNSNCACELNKPEEVQTTRTDYTFFNSKKVQPYYIIDQTGVDHQNCLCNGKTDRGNSHLSPKHTARSSSTDRKSCRLCGTVYQNNRKCGCRIKNYPNPVAYELSFLRENKCAGEVDVEIKCIDKNARAENNLKSHDECTCENEEPVTKKCVCDCRKSRTRKSTETKCTLQDYLVSNNPNFADNVETRRQYVSEIQRLRQLRKDRRVQLLAMATTTTNIFSSSRPTKITKCVQRKIPDQEMKSRLRRRYSQLSEVRAKRRQQRLQEEARCNKLMAKIFCKKLQQKVLKGQVDLSQSVSVISNL